MRELHLFAGAGGGILGGMLLGHTPVCAVEIEEYPRRVLLQRQRDGVLPRFPIWDDICTFDGRDWRGRVDVVCGGFPCQDISAAGKGAGLAGERSGLWSEMARVVSEVRPRYVFVENSPLLVSRGLDVVLGDLAALGYDARWGVVGAHNAAAPHKRDRIWIVGHANGHGQPDMPVDAAVEGLRGHLSDDPSQRRGTRWGGDLIQAVRGNENSHFRMWQTPVADDAVNREAGKWNSRGEPKLSAQVKLLPAPTASTGGPEPEGKTGRKLATVVGGGLNPPWVEWLMNWPINWTSTQEIESDDFKRWQKASTTNVLVGGAGLLPLWFYREPAQAPQGSRHGEQCEIEYRVPLCELPRQDACNGEVGGTQQGSSVLELRSGVHLSESEAKALQSDLWQQDGMEITRTAKGVMNRVDRLKAIGNGQVPLCAAMAWTILSGMDEGE